jgi:hypothetical protein
MCQKSAILFLSEDVTWEMAGQRRIISSTGLSNDSLNESYERTDGGQFSLVRVRKLWLWHRLIEIIRP